MTKQTHCKNQKKHTDFPVGYFSWHTWAAKKAKTHKQIKCPDCGLYAVWVKK